MNKREIYSSEHELFRKTVRHFLEKEFEPNRERWEAQGHFDREFFRKAGEAGILCPTLPEEYGGAGGDFLYSAIVLEEGAAFSNIGLSLTMHSEIVGNYILHYGSEEIKQRFLPRMATGELVGALGMTEPGAGSDVKAIRTSANLAGGHYVLNGAKTFISNATVADFVVVVAKTDPAAGAKGVSLLIAEKDMPGFTKGAPLRKMGLKSQDTGELFFADVCIPVANLLGEQGKGFTYSMQELPWERLQLAISAMAAAEAAFQWTVDYVRERKAFGQSVLDFQATRFSLAELKTEIQIGRIFVDHCIAQLAKGGLDSTTASMAKYWCSDLQCKVVDVGVQLHGGYGYMWEYPIARAYVDARAQRIYGGTNEIMKELISRTL
ncbi:acyl-CoA dehydrogenase family protein [Janthinobacterium sp. PC23-8]|uniref:acyl-CoA dehydrogenase family protein n=1 Tax=Janthinobacterium sp. PC23-8 TaxID=2012679 RepID=UPI000B9715C3|nr:acyl-CoA dehydrogenase family protein [Janthinobacterium sp. PC23-8]OYO26347.1 acyl-CoA dehydrogenase [Janthinobacterium sp. PC23-8]